MTLKELVKYAGWLVLAILGLSLAAILGYWGPWYFAWTVGTIMTVLLAAFAGALYDRQAQDYGEEGENPEEPGPES